MDKRLEMMERAVEALEAAVSRQDRRIAALEGRETTEFRGLRGHIPAPSERLRRLYFDASGTRSQLQL